MNGQILEKLKKEYLSIVPAENQVIRSWNELQLKLAQERIRPIPHFSQRPALAFVSILIVITAFILIGSRFSKPDDALYPVKIASDKIVAGVTGNYEANIEKRAQEVINSATDPEDGIDEATRKYLESLEEAREKAQEMGKSQEFKTILDQQEERFRQVQEENPSSQRGLEEAINNTQKVKGEVQGQKDENPPNNNQNQNQNNNQGQQKGKNK